VNREDAAAAVNNLSAAAINVERLYVAAEDLEVRAVLARVRQDVKAGIARLQRLQRLPQETADGGAV
jgi:hypothetical protein